MEKEDTHLSNMANIQLPVVDARRSCAISWKNGAHFISPDKISDNRDAEIHISYLMGETNVKPVDWTHVKSKEKKKEKVQQSVMANALHKEQKKKKEAWANNVAKTEAAKQKRERVKAHEKRNRELQKKAAARRAAP